VQTSRTESGNEKVEITSDFKRASGLVSNSGTIESGDKAMIWQTFASRILEVLSSAQRLWQDWVFKS